MLRRYIQVEPMLDEGSRTSSTRRRIQATAGIGAFWTTTLLIVSIILLAILLGWIPMRGTPLVPNVTVVCMNGNLTANSLLCNQTSACLQGYLSADNLSCTYYAEPNTRSCIDACTSRDNLGGMCDAGGMCMGNVSSCPGTCTFEGQCGGFTVVNSDVKEYFDPVTLWTWSSWYEPLACYYGSCIWLIFDIEMTSTTDILQIAPSPVAYNFSVGGARTLCQDYFETSFIQNYSKCLMFERYMLAANLTNYTFYGPTNQFLYGNNSYPFQTGVCILSFTCGFTIDAVAPPPIGKRVVESLNGDNPEPPFKTRTQWGLLPVTHTGSTSAGGGEEEANPLGITDPRLQNRFYAFLHDTYVEAAPIYLPTFIQLNQQRLQQRQAPRPQPAGGS